MLTVPIYVQNALQSGIAARANVLGVSTLKCRILAVHSVQESTLSDVFHRVLLALVCCDLGWLLVMTPEGGAPTYQTSWSNEGCSEAV